MRQTFPFRDFKRKGGTDKLSAFPFPPNIAKELSKELTRTILQFLQTNYVWPQIQARRPYEDIWDRLLNMARATWKISDMNLTPDQRQSRAMQDKILNGVIKGDRAEVADTIIFDAVDRLSNLNHYISFRDELPVQFIDPKFRVHMYESEVYHPTKDFYLAANCWLKFNADNTDFYRHHWMTAKHNYTYGVCFAESTFVYKWENRPTIENGQHTEKPFLTKIGTTFKGISLRKLWINTSIPPFQMDLQPCPFYYDVVPRFAIVANAYHPEDNPFGYQNLDKLPKGQWKTGSTEYTAALTALTQYNPDLTFDALCRPEYDTELRWTMYPMLPLQKFTLQQINENETLQGLFNTQYKGVELPEGFSGEIYLFHEEFPLNRYIIELFGTSLVMGNVAIIRLQRNFYPNDCLPLYGSGQMTDYDSGAYPPAVGTILEDHYRQIVKAIGQFLDNKDILNDPPTLVQFASPANNHDLNKAGARIPVNGMNDVQDRKSFVDHTGTTPSFIEATRNQAKTATKAVDAVLGQAMGARTTATEAGNVFQTAMSGVTTDVNLYNHDISGGFAERVVFYTRDWVDADVINAVTGTDAFQIKDEHFYLNIGIATNAGSRFMESLTRQNHYRYILESAKNDPNIDSGVIWEALLTEWRIPGIRAIVKDQGYRSQILEATDQAIRTYMGDLVLVDPEQDHQLAIQVKLAFLKDRQSVYNTREDYVVNSPNIVEQIKQHQQFLYLQLLQQQANEPIQLPEGHIGEGNPTTV